MTMSEAHIQGTTPARSLWLAHPEPAAAVLGEGAKVMPATGRPLYRPSERSLCPCSYGVCCSEAARRGRVGEGWAGALAPSTPIGGCQPWDFPHMWGMTPGRCFT